MSLNQTIAGINAKAERDSKKWLSSTARNLASGVQELSKSAKLVGININIPLALNAVEQKKDARADLTADEYTDFLLLLS